MLDERGIKYVSINGCTNWTQPSGYTAVFDETMDESDTRLTVYAATPEQAIAATVGRGTCRNVSDVDGIFVCSECKRQIGGMTVLNGARRWVVPPYCPNCGRRVVE